MHYIEYIPGTIARIIDEPAAIPVRTNGHQCQSEDINLLSRIVAKFNSWLFLTGYLQLEERRFIELRTIILKYQ